MSFSMKNGFSIFNFQTKIGNWKFFIIFQFSIWIEIEIHKNVLFHSNFKMKIEWHFRCTDWSPFDQRIIHGLNELKWFFNFQNNWILKFKFEVHFSSFILIWRTKNQIYLNKYLTTSVYENVHFILVQFSVISKKWKLILGNFRFKF